MASSLIEKAKKVTEVENKLRQAMETVRQADVIDQKLEETRARNSALVASRGSSSRSHEGGAPPKEKNSQAISQHLADNKAEKLHREHRRMRKEIAAAIASRESTKAKLERMEKERDLLAKANARLLKQSSEKDDINAKSLSTILHLKELTEQLKREKELTEQQIKSAGQLSLATRLVSNAKERLSEVLSKERSEWERKVKELEEVREALKQERQHAVLALKRKEAEMARVDNETSEMRARCEELVATSAAETKEKQHLMEKLAVAQRETSEIAKKLVRIQSKVGGSEPSGFTTEQLTTQITVLKGRLTCPVCNHRDKKCILLRCRHMFCKQCVEENIRNRSRKCPACGQRFDNKDVEDIWL
eukprot:CAMPEP_0116577744 /NCGR_PEP_ID=MMETSP0397-20121206/21315_1 /TAXON_ID=216820 /ORGANISM="Cyclophora tenuis, Strain ECT3854" /LENGTH=361 /DNA_ID=CAMNT_0004107045 /DNA_START=7 /DNA_END=1093 /DNA_ORIENTATION=+